MRKDSWIVRIKYTGVTVARMGNCFAFMAGKRSFVVKAPSRLSPFEVSRRVRRFVAKLTPWPVYFIMDSTDCDLCNVVRAVRYPNGWTASRRIEVEYENAEGPLYFERVSKAEYETFENSWRDIAAEKAGY